MKVLNFYSQVFADQLRNGRKSGTIRLGDKSHKYERNDLVLVTIGFKHSPRERVFEAVIDDVEVKPLKELSPHEIQHDNPECRRVGDLMSFLEQIYDRPVTLDDTVTIVRFSEIVDRASDFEDRLRGLGGARN
ncbi:MAG: ASCH domain-containing protein [Solirubrobacterales bacterium]|nr:ASCH domain-containing protein [Solirubrobacterales bacterium]